MTNFLLRIVNTILLILFPVVLIAQAVAPGDLIITEFMADPVSASDSEGEYVELYNKRAVAIDIDGFTLRDDGSNSHSIDNGGPLLIPAGSFIVLAASNTPGFTPDYVYSGFTLANSGDQIVLTDPDGNEIGRTNYTGSEVTSGVAAELNAIANVDENGEINPSNFQNSTSAIGNGDSGSPGTAGSTDLSENPTVRFTDAGATVHEGDGTVNIQVMIEDPDGNSVDVDVVFQQSPSTAESSDFTGPATQTVSFSAGASDGDAQSASITLDDDTNFEGVEKAMFNLANIATSGTATISGQTEFTLTINDNDVPEVVINEIHADPDATTGDADGNGTVSSGNDEFVEIVSAEPVSINIGGWTISDGSGVKHTFDPTTILPANGAAVVFGGSDFTGDFGGAVVQGTGSLGLNNGGDTVTLKDASGVTIDEHTYGSEGGDNQSLVREPDLTGSFVKHSSAAGSGGSLFSPGVKTDGLVFTTAIFIEGDSGWRMLAPPAENMAISDLTDDSPIQGFGDGFEKNFFTGYDGSSFTAPSNLMGSLNSGEGFIMYFFNNNDAGSSTLPVAIDVGTGPEPSSDVTVAVHADGDGWNLLGNPFQTAFDISSLIQNNGSLSSSVGSVWSDEDESYILTSANEDKIAPGQGFFIQNDTASAGNPAASVTFPISGKATGTKFFKSERKQRAYALLILQSKDIKTGGRNSDLSTMLYFHEDATEGRDHLDVGKLYPLKASYSILGIKSADGAWRAQESRPFEFSKIQTFHLDIEAMNVISTHKMKWQLVGIPEGWEVLLKDRITGKEINLRKQLSYTFSVSENEISVSSSTALNPGILKPLKRKSVKTPARFIVEVIPPTAVSTEEPPGTPVEYVLEQNFPNPFNPSTVIRYQLPAASVVRLEVYDILGRRIATLIDKQSKSAGTHSVIFNAAGLSSGIYFYRLTAGSIIKTKKLTLIE